MFAPRIDERARVLLPGDFLVVAGVFVAGTVHHHGIDVLTTRPLYVLTTILPFLIGWAVAGPLLGAYGPRAVAAAHDSAVVAVRAWTLGAVIAVLLRASPLFSGGASTIFFLITLGTGAAGLAIWRVVAVWIR
ncbi:MAG: DUF3054 domain-containing protein [Haloferacaceae archaeon]